MIKRTRKSRITKKFKKQMEDFNNQESQETFEEKSKSKG
jgi:Sec-independent protein translocase protein TatA